MVENNILQKNTEIKFYDFFPIFSIISGLIMLVTLIFFIESLGLAFSRPRGPFENLGPYSFFIPITFMILGFVIGLIGLKKSEKTVSKIFSYIGMILSSLPMILILFMVLLSII